MNVNRILVIFLIFNLSTVVRAQVKYADVILDAYYSGSNPAFSDFYGLNGGSSGIEYVDPSVCTGNTPWFVSLPSGSYVTVGFVDNIIFNAPNQNDIFIQEVGEASELADIYVSSDNGLTFTFFGKIDGGQTNAIDLEDIGYTGLVNAIKIVGLDNNGASPGFDVARIYGIKGANCSADAAVNFPIVCQDSILDIGKFSGDWSGSILESNQINTLDTGTFFLTHIVQDQFPVCPNDTALISVHITPCDCQGTPYGDFEMDDCDICLDPADDLFGVSCVDCAGVPFGNASVDACGQCLPQGDTSRCSTENIAYFPNIFSPNNDGVNDFFKIFFREGVVGEMIEFSIYNRWGEQVFSRKAASIRALNLWWDGNIREKKAPTGVYVYHIRAELANGEFIEYSGDVTLVR